MGNYKETLYLWELVSLCLDLSPGARKRSTKPTPHGTPSSSGTASNWKKKNNQVTLT